MMRHTSAHKDTAAEVQSAYERGRADALGEFIAYLEQRAGVEAFAAVLAAVRVEWFESEQEQGIADE